MSISRGNKSSLLAASGSGYAVTWPSNPTAGQKILIALWTSASTTVTNAVDNGTSPTTYAFDLTETNSSGQHLYILRADNITLPSTGSYTVTLTVSGSSTVVGGGIAYSGVNPGGPTATNFDNATSGTAISTNSATPDFAGALAFAAFTTDLFVTTTISAAGGGFTNQFTELTGASFAPGALADQIISGGPSAETCTWTAGNSASWVGSVAVYDVQQVTVTLTTPNIALAAPLVAPSAGATVALTTPNVALAAPLVAPSFPVSVALTTPNVALAAPAVTPVTSVAPDIIATWSGSYSRTPTAYVAGPPPLAPLAIPVANTAGNWLFAIVSWRQDAGTAGVLQYPTTVSITDDADNFWIPVGNGLSNAFGLSDAGITRPVIWMAPAARAAQHVFVSPTGYQSALTVQIVEIAGACPWYEVAVVVSDYTNQGGSITLSQDPAAGLFSLGAITWDNTGGSVSTTASGWTGLTPVITSNGADHSGDLHTNVWYATSTGSTMTLSGSGSPTMDWAAVIITVHGVTDLIPFPYTVPDVGNWPVLITEIATGSMTSSNPMFAEQLAGWSTFAGASATAVTWPQLAGSVSPDYGAFTPGFVAQVVPTGASDVCSLTSSLYPVSPTVQYNALAYVYSPGGFGDGGPPLSGTGGYVGIYWYDASQTLIYETTTTQIAILAGSWTQLTLSAPVFPPENAAYGQCAVTQWNGGADIPATAVFYVGYAAFGPSGAYEDIPADEIAWTDISTRNFTQDSIKITRGIQYEQQSLEAGTMTVNLANNDGFMIFGNSQSPYWPFAGDTDVPIRLRAVWQQSVTPYYVLFSGFTDQIEFGWDDDEGTWYGYASVEASDAWSRLTAQTLTALEQEVLEDNPVSFATCSLSGSNEASGNTTPMVTTPSQFGAVTGTANFGSSALSLLGGQGLNCWESSGTGISGALGEGVALTYFPPVSNPLPPTSGGVTMEFWMSGQVAGNAGQPIQALTLCTCWSGSGPMWSITLDNTGLVLGVASICVYDQATGAVTRTLLNDGVVYLNTVNTPIAWFFTVSFTETSLTVGSGISYGSQTTVSCNLAPTILGFSFGGNAGPLFAFNYGGNTPGFMNVAIADVAVFAGIVPPARLAAHWETASLAWPSELDTSRLARIAGYAGATPVVLAMRCLDLPSPPAADVDPVTAVTDTSGQTTSSYFTNIASSTLAAMFVDGAGALVYRRRLEWYNRPSPQWVLGESAPYPVNANSSFTEGTSGWFTANGASLSSSSIANGGNAGPWFASCGLFTGNGSTALPEIGSGSLATLPVTPGDIYQLSALVYSPQGWTSGVSVIISWFTAGSSFISDTVASSPVAPGSLTYLSTTPTVAAGAQAPATAAFAQIYVQAAGTPSSSVQFYVTDVVFTPVGVVTAGGAGAVAPETPYLPTAKLSSDRALLFNQAILTQYGTNTQVTYTGADLVFQPTSGVTVLIQNNASVAARAGVPYTATIYLNNTVQTLPYYLDEASMEDFGNWITQTLASPLLRPETVTITPAATPEAMLMGLGAEIGDTTTFRRRPQTGGAPEIEVLTYVSKLTHTIKIDDEQPWKTEYELSPFQVGSVLQCDSVINGTLTSNNVLGF